MVKQKKIPQRMCVGCQTMHDKRELLRVVHTPEDEFVVDATGKKAGRGAYVCANEECLAKAFKERRLEKAFKAQVDIKVYESLKQRLLEHE